MLLAAVLALAHIRGLLDLNTNFKATTAETQPITVAVVAVVEGFQEKMEELSVAPKVEIPKVVEAVTDIHPLLQELLFIMAVVAVVASFKEATMAAEVVTAAADLAVDGDLLQILQVLLTQVAAAVALTVVETAEVTVDPEQ
jgi:hypothetical protein